MAEGIGATQPALGLAKVGRRWHLLEQTFDRTDPHNPQHAGYRQPCAASLIEGPANEIPGFLKVSIDDSALPELPEGATICGSCDSNWRRKRFRRFRGER